MLTAKRRRTGIDRESFQKGDSELSKAGQERLDRLIERKYMSTKTVTKRLALATVVALGAGVLSLVSVSSASAAVNSWPATQTTTSSTAAAADALIIGTALPTTGSVSPTTTTAAFSIGLVNVNSVANDLYAGTTQTATLLSTGEISVGTIVNSTPNGVCFVTNGIIKHAAGTSNVLNSTGTAYCTAGNAVATNSLAIGVAPVSGANFSIQLYRAATAAASISSPTSGTLIGAVNVTVSSASVGGVVSVANSGIYYDSASSEAAAIITDTTSSGWGSTVPFGKTNYANITVKDAYGVAVASTTGLLTATATNGAYVALASSGNAVAKGTQSTAFLALAAPHNAQLSVAAPSSSPVTTVVTIAYNGVTVGTKTFTFTGDVAKVTLGTPGLIGNLSQSAALAKGASITFQDSAGNVIYPVASDPYYPTSGFFTDASSINTAALSQTPTSTATGYIDWSCGATAGTNSTIVDYINTDGTIAKSNAITTSCASSAYTYTAAWDKSSYTPGSIATLSVTFKDSKGNLSNDIGAKSTTVPVVTVSGGTIVAAPTTSDQSSLGVITYKAIVGTSNGSFASTVTFPTVNSANSAQTVQTAGFSVADGGTSLNDVLKGIVSLIASINKQIAALAKLVAPAKKK